MVTGSAKLGRSKVATYLDPVQGMLCMTMNNTVPAGESAREAVQAPVRYVIRTTCLAATRGVGPQAFMSYEFILELFTILSPLFEVRLRAQASAHVK